MLILKRAVMWTLGSLSVAMLAASMLQWHLIPPLQFLLTQYDHVIQRLAIFLQPITLQALHKFAVIVPLNPALHSQWPHLLLILALQFLPRTEPFPGWNILLQLAFKLIAAGIGIVLAFSLSIALGTYPWRMDQSDLLFMLFGLTLAIYFQNWLADWPSIAAPLDEEDLLPAFGPKPKREYSTDYEWPFMAIAAALVVTAFAIAFITVEVGILQESTLTRVIILTGTGLAMLVAFLLWISFESGTNFLGPFLGFFGTPDDPFKSPLSVIGRFALLVAASSFWFGSFWTSSQPPTENLLIQVSLLIVCLIALAVGQRLFLAFIPPDGDQRNYPFPSALGIFVVGASLLFGVNQVLSS